MIGRQRVAVVGGGPAGAVAALVLARRGLDVVVIESRKGPGQKIGETLPPSLTPLLQRLGLAGLLERDGQLRAEGIRAVWGGERAVDRAFLSDPRGLGWHVDRRDFEARLAVCAGQAGASWRWGWRVAGVTALPSGSFRAAPAGVALPAPGDGEPRWRLELRRTAGSGGPGDTMEGTDGGQPASGGGPGPAAAAAKAEAGPAGAAGAESRSGSVLQLDVHFVVDASGRAAHVARRQRARRVRYDRLVGIAAMLPSATAKPTATTTAKATVTKSAKATVTTSAKATVTTTAKAAVTTTAKRTATTAAKAAVTTAAPAPGFGPPAPGLAALADAVPAGYTLVEAVPEGWWYSAELADGRLAVGLFGDGDLLDRSLLGGDRERVAATWLRRLGETRETAARVAARGPLPGRLDPRVLPAESSRLDAILGAGWLAVGDAAAAYDPLSSHGVASAMGSGFYGGNAVADLLAGSEDAGAAYLGVMQDAYGAYLDLLRAHYATERRWPDAPFWRRRHRPDFGVAPI
jgi:flavin-dependent dehydrogenase